MCQIYAKIAPFFEILKLSLQIILKRMGSPTNSRGIFTKLAFARCDILQQSSTLIVYLYFSSSLSLLTFRRSKSYKSARHRQNQSQQPFAHESQATSLGWLWRCGALLWGAKAPVVANIARPQWCQQIHLFCFWVVRNSFS